MIAVARKNYAGDSASPREEKKMIPYSQAEKWRQEIHGLVDQIEDPYWLQYVLQLVHMIDGCLEEIYPEVEEEDEDE